MDGSQYRPILYFSFAGHALFKLQVISSSEKAGLKLNVFAVEQCCTLQMTFWWDVPSQCSSILAIVSQWKRKGSHSSTTTTLDSRKAVDLTPHGHHHKFGHLGNLGNSFRTRFERLGAISRTHLGISFRARFERLGELRDLEDAISTLRNVVDLTLSWTQFRLYIRPHKPVILDNHGISFRARFKHVEQLSVLEDAISTFRVAVDLTPRGHPHKPAILGNVRITFRDRFEHFGDRNYAIPSLRDTVGLTPHGNPRKPGHLHNLGTAFFSRFERPQELSDLEDVTFTLRDAHLGRLNVLVDAISTLRNTVDLTPHGHPEKSHCLDNIWVSLRARFEQLGELRDLEDRVSTLRHAVDLALMVTVTSPPS
ncbi:hypothetical protein L210DRAFT_3761883 [Boletus edulis BED1]|uniref:Uncharacterized protein n=1 Tax=Boletus edulis BED1 TaxID=1328754 RepID=A0AAD4GDC0_BOLED|nr:hypothetical protein L210DRAFT_3761883 [Boletus edulis BED1]